MQNGTHTEAIKAGFTTEQAVLFTRACMDIKNECWQHFEKRLYEREIARKQAVEAKISKYTPVIIALCVGISIGAAIANSIE